MGLKSWNQLKMVDNIKTSQFEWKNLGLSISLSLLSQISDNGEMAEQWQPRVPQNAQFILKTMPNGWGTPTVVVQVSGNPVSALVSITADSRLFVLSTCAELQRWDGVATDLDNNSRCAPTVWHHFWNKLCISGHSRLPPLPYRRFDSADWD